MSAGDTIQYFVVAQDTVVPPNVSINSGTFNAQPASVALTATAFPITGTINSYQIQNSISGTKTVCASGCDFATITLAVAALNSSLITGNVTFNLTDATYPSETFPITINANSGSNGVNGNVLIKPTGVTTITGSNATTIFDLNGCTFVTIDGSNSGGLSPSGDLTISNTNTSGATIQFINAASNNVVQRATLKGVSTSASNGIVFFSTTASGTVGCSNNTVKNNTITGGATATVNGVYMLGTSGILGDANTVTGNTVNDFSAAGLYESITIRTRCSARTPSSKLRRKRRLHFRALWSTSLRLR